MDQATDSALAAGPVFDDITGEAVKDTDKERVRHAPVKRRRDAAGGALLCPFRTAIAHKLRIASHVDQLLVVGG